MDSTDLKLLVVLDIQQRVARVPLSVGSRTGLFVPDLNELFVSVSQSAKQPAELLVFETK